MVLATLAAPLNEPYFLGSGMAPAGILPSPWDVALDGRPFMVVTDHDAIEVFGQHWRRQSVPLIRDQADQSDEPGEQSISPEQFWRRSQQTWHKGAGQNWLDWPGSDRDRFRSSKGVNVWTQKQVTLLNSTTQSRVSTNTGLRLAVAGSRVYLADGATLAYTTDGTTWTTVTGTPGTTITSVTSDGFNVYAACGTSGIYKTDTSGGAASSYVTQPVSLVGYVKGRLMAANANSLYNITTSGPLPSALWTHSNTGFAWVSFTEAPGFIYAAGFAGGRSEVYSIGITDAATSLSAPTIATTLPEGEIVRRIYGYLGFLLVGADKGLRLCTTNQDGSLVLGGLITTPGSVQCFDGEDRFVWFGWTNYDTTSTGLGRVDLSVFTQTLTPAYASDLMATTQGTVASTAILGSSRLFTVDGSGVWIEQANTPVASGTLLSGFISYDVADEKQAVYLDLRHEPLPSGGSVVAALAVDNGSFATVGTSDVVNTTAPQPFYLNGAHGERFEVQLTINAGTSSPTVTRYTLRADVTPAPTSLALVPLMIADGFNLFDTEITANPGEDYDALIALHESQVIFSYQVGTRDYLVKMVDYEWLPQKRSANLGDWTGVFIAHLRHLTG